jgi:uncharacterized ion transporter superfamily protein YfcC
VVTEEVAEQPKRGQLHPLLIVLAMMLAAVALTHFVPAGKFERHGKQVVAGSYRPIAKIDGLPALLAPSAPTETDELARAAGVVAVFTAIPAGMVKAAPLFFMIMFVGGTFGILRATGVIDAGVDRLLQLTSGNVYLLSASLIVLLACGSTFLGFSSEYIALIPVVMTIAKRIGLPNLFAPAVIALADFIGYGTSVTNPIVLGIAQPMAGVPVFSGMLPRLVVFLVLLTIGLLHVMLWLRRLPKLVHVPEAAPLGIRHLGVLVALVAGGAALIAGTSLSHWESPQLAAAFIALGVLFAIVAGMGAGRAADAFLDGMKGMLLPCLLIGLGAAIAGLLQSSLVLDTIVHAIATVLEGGSPGGVGMGIMSAEMLFGVLIPSASAKAAVSIPILAPIAHLSGVGGQVTVSALLYGSGMTNMITPTNPLLLAFLAAARVGYGEWVRFVAPLVVVFSAVCFTAIFLMVTF